MPAERIRRIPPQEAQEHLTDHLRRYVDIAVAEGAADARIVKASDVTIDERIRMKCRIPQCSVYGQCFNCPPNSPGAGQMAEVLANYTWAVAFKIDVPPAVIVWEQETYPARSKAYRSVTLIANAVESAAFYDGHYLAIGFGAGSCKTAFCREVECIALKGEECRFSLRARPSMESVGMDAFRLAAQLDWEVYPIGSGAKAEMVPIGMMMGVVFVE